MTATPPLIPDPGFAGDTGATPPELADALDAVGADPGRRPQVLAALHGARVFAAVAAGAPAPPTAASGPQVSGASPPELEA